MRGYKMPLPARTSVTVPQLSGGVNKYDVPNRIADNQLSDCNNMWWHDGALRTRPGLSVLGASLPKLEYNSKQIVNEREMLLTDMYNYGDGISFSAAKMSINEGLQKLGAGGFSYYGKRSPEGYALTALGIEADKNDATGWYYLLSNGEVIKENNKDNLPQPGFGWVKTEPYVPTVVINGTGTEWQTSNGYTGNTMYEDFNMLTRAYRCEFTTDGVSYTWNLPERKLATDIVGEDVNDETGGKMAVVELTLKKAGSGKIRTISAEFFAETAEPMEQRKKVAVDTDEAPGSGYTEMWLEITFNPKDGCVKTIFRGKDSTGKITAPIGGPLAVDTNNLKITVWRNRKYEKERMTICRMTRGIWFGGDRSGVEGGSRFFVCGNPDKPNLVHWSGIEHPTYFPEHNYTYVGEPGQAVTAFGKQGDLLVLYKAREMYAIQYVAGDNTDMDFATSGGVSITTYMAQFPMTPINAMVGCDCPDTVRLVNNRLVWATSTGEVYMLTAVDQYNERNVRMISRNIQAELAATGKDALQQAVAGEYFGYYLLLVNNKVFLLDTQTSAFSSFNYYSNEDGARKALPWFVWTLPERYAYAGMVACENQVRLTVCDRETDEAKALMLAGDKDEGSPIACYFTTKLWDFDRPDYKKSIEQMYLGVGCAEQGIVQLTYVTEKGSFADPYMVVDRRNAVGRALRYICKVRVTPNVRMVQCFGARFDCNTTMEVDGLFIKVRQQGVVR